MIKKNIFRLYNNVKRSIEKEMLLLRPPPKKKSLVLRPKLENLMR